MLRSGSVGGCAGRILFSVVGRSSCGPLAPLQVRTPPRPLLRLLPARTARLLAVQGETDWHTVVDRLQRRGVRDVDARLIDAALHQRVTHRLRAALRERGGRI